MLVAAFVGGVTSAGNVPSRWLFHRLEHYSVADVCCFVRLQSLVNGLVLVEFLARFLLIVFAKQSSFLLSLLVKLVLS